MTNNVVIDDVAKFLDNEKDEQIKKRPKLKKDPKVGTSSTVGAQVSPGT